MRHLTAFSLFLSLATPAVAGDFRLASPIDCVIGQDCHIQQYVDHDTGPGARDFRCGTLSYDGHTGTDFALPDLAAMHSGVQVRATAPGVVTGWRDGMADRYLTDQNRAEVANRGCGNGVAIRHANGWETRYCHLKQGSIAVRTGDQVAAGDLLGQVGLSGKTQFPHLELIVEKDGQTVDPFNPEPRDTCDGSGETLWADPPAYTPGGLISVGFSDAIPDYADIRAGTADLSPLPADAPALVFWAYAWGSRSGDLLQLHITGPDGVFASHQAELDRTQAQLFRATGKRRKTATWPSGTYRGSATLIRNRHPLDQADFSMTIP
jgi:hypothetical protein